MKILLFGEFSGFHTNLKKGLEEHGHEVTLLSDGDWFKNIKGDINISLFLKYSFLTRIEKTVKLWLNLWKFRNYDIVQLISINDAILPHNHFQRILYIKFLKRNNYKIFYNSCGTDFHYVKTSLVMPYSPIKNEILNGNFNTVFKYLNKRERIYSIKVTDLFDGIISSAYSYHLAYSHLNNYLGGIPMPVSLKKDKDWTNDIQGKIKIFHGISRGDFKGSDLIVEALNLIKLKYENEVDIKIVKHIPFREYMKLFNETNIVIDQACSYGYGMNALFALEKAKVVLSGNEPENQSFVGEKCPVINIQPNVQHIYSQIEKLILEKESISSIGEEGRAYVLKNHDSFMIAEKYIEFWKMNLKLT